MFDRFNDAARRVVVLAQEEASMLRHQHIGTEHILLALVRHDGAAAAVLETLGCSRETVRTAVLDEAGPGTIDAKGFIPFTFPVRKVLERALREALIVGQDMIGDEHLLQALLQEGEGIGASILTGNGVSYEEVRRLVAGSRDAQVERVFSIFIRSDESGTECIYPTAEAAADAGPGDVEAVQVTLRPGEYFTLVQEGAPLPGAEKYLDFRAALDAAQTVSVPSAEVAIMTPTTEEVMALSSTGRRVSLGKATTWSARPLAA